MTIDEHVVAIQAAFAAAKEDGYKPDLWFDYDEQGDVGQVIVKLIQLRRGEYGWMQVVERSDLFDWSV